MYQHLWHKCGVYAIRRLSDGKCYIGSSRNIGKRWGSHQWHLRRGTHHSLHLQQAWNSGAFELVILEECTADLLPVQEQKWITLLRAADRHYGFNVGPVAYSRFGTKASPETLLKMSTSQQRREPATEETRAKMSAAAKLRNARPEYLAKMRIWTTGKYHSAETRQKLREFGLNYQFTKQHLQNIREGVKNATRIAGQQSKAINLGWITRRNGEICGRGHTLTADNTRVRPGRHGRTYKTCRACAQMKQRERRGSE